MLKRFLVVFVALPALAQMPDITPMLGEEWYGLYLNGQKTGFAVNRIARAEGGGVTVMEEAKFKMNMSGIPQDMATSSTRSYDANGALLSVSSQVVDLTGTSAFDGKVDGEELVVHSVVGGNETKDRLPKPKESLVDALKYSLWVRDPARKQGDTTSFSLFEPMYQHELSERAEITGIEERILDGVATKVFAIKSTIDLLHVESKSYVTAEGTMLEGAVAGIITMRLEPEAKAKDVSYANDVIVSNAARVNQPIKNPQTRPSLHLLLRGPLTSDHLFSDERQTVTAAGDAFDFRSTRPDLKDFQDAALPIGDPAMEPWLKPTLYVQSDHPSIVAKAKDIAGDEKKTRKISDKLCAWVHDNVRQTYSARMTNAVEVLQNLNGDCTEASTLFVALARAAGVPAREVAGVIYVGDGFYFHQWAKVWIGKWLDVDPTFNQPIADVTHVKLAEGDLLEQAKLIPVIGQLKVEVLEDAPAEKQAEAK